MKSGIRPRRRVSWSEIQRQLVFQKHIGADIAVLPEAVLPYAIIGDPGMQAWAEQLTHEFGGPVLMGALAAEGASLSDDPWYNGFMILFIRRMDWPDLITKRESACPMVSTYPSEISFSLSRKFVSGR